MDLVDELERLSALHRNRALTDEEYSRAKAALLSRSPEAPPSDPLFDYSHEPESAPTQEISRPAGRRPRAVQPPRDGDAVVGHLADIRYQNELARIDREWELEREQHMVRGRRWGRHVPGAGDVVGAIVAAAFGVFWTVMTFRITRGAPGPLEIPAMIFPLFGIVFVIAAIVSGLSNYSKLEAYNSAYAAYQARRNSVRRR